MNHSDQNNNQQAAEVRKQLLETDSLWRSMFENSPVAVMIVEPSGKIFYANHAFARQSGADLIGKKIYDFIPPEHHQKIKKALDDVIRTGQSGYYKIMVPIEGKDEWYESYAGPVRRDGKVVAVNITTLEITEKTKTEEALQESNRLLEVVTGNMSDLVAICDSDFIFTYVSPSYTNILGYSPEDLLGKPIYELAHETELASIIQQLEDGKEKKMPGAFAVHRLRHKSGNYLWFETKAKALYDDEGKPMGAEFNLREITDRKKTEDLLQESEERYQAFFNSHNLVFVSDIKGNFIDANRAALDLMGYENWEIQSMNVSDIVHPDQSLEPILKAAEELLVGGTLKEKMEVTLVTKDKQRKILEIKISLIKERELILGVANDITGLKLAQGEYRKSEARYRELVNEWPIGIYEIDFLQGKVVGVNEPLCQLSGYSREELFNMNPANFLTEESQQKYFQRLEKMLQGEAVPNFMEYQIVKKNGGIRDVRLNANYRRQDGQIISANVVVEDITEQKQSREELRKSDQRLQDIFDNMKEGYYRAEMDGKIVWTNRAAMIIAGYESYRDVMGKNIADDFYQNPEDRESFLADLMTDGTANSEIAIKGKDGSVIVVESNSRLIYDKEGNPAYVDGIFWDVTERIKAEAEIEKTRSYLESIIDSSPSAIICYDENKRITQWNKTTEDLTGLFKSEALGQTLKDILPHYEVYADSFDRALRDKKHLREEKVRFELNDRIYFFDMMLYPLIDYGAQGVVARIDDVTERMRMEETMIQTEKMMSLGGMSAGMAHEINNPLAGILQTAQNLMRRLNPDLDKYPNIAKTNLELAAKCGTDPEKVREYLELRGIFSAIEGIQSAGDRAVKIIRNMLEFGRENSSEIQPEPLHELLENSIQLASQDYDLQKHYDFRNIQIKKNYDLRIKKIPCSKSEFEQVILNLLKNSAEAIKEIETEGYAPQITLKTTRRGQLAQIQIIDNGPGMDLATQKRIFDPFFTTKEVGQGTGLGLSVSYFIIKNHHSGEMFVESNPGKGTTFTIQLPMEIPSSE